MEIEYRPECCQDCVVTAQPLPHVPAWVVAHLGIGEAVAVFSDREVRGGESDGKILTWLRGVHEYEDGVRALS